MSRVLDALRNLQQPQPAPPAHGEKVTPRLAASIRRAVLGSQADKSGASATQTPAESLLLFRVPEIAAPKAAPVATNAVANAPAVVEPVVVQQVADPATDSLSLVDAIAASLRDVSREDAPSGEPRPIPRSSPESPTPALPRARPEPTANELELYSILADVRSSEPYRNLLRAVQRETQGLTSPVVALIGLDERDSTAFVAACLGALISEEESRKALLLEGHATNRMLAKMYGVPHAIGLCEQLARRADRSQTIVSTSQQNLFVLPFGQPHAEEVRPLTGKLRESVRELRYGYEMVFMDAGPLYTPWALAASQAADITYLLVRLGDALTEQAVAAVNQFRAAGGKVNGCVAIDAANTHQL